MPTVLHATDRHTCKAADFSHRSRVVSSTAVRNFSRCLPFEQASRADSETIGSPPSFSSITRGHWCLHGGPPGHTRRSERSAAGGNIFSASLAIGACIELRRELEMEWSSAECPPSIAAMRWPVMALCRSTRLRRLGHADASAQVARAVKGTSATTPVACASLSYPQVVAAVRSLPSPVRACLRHSSYVLHSRVPLFCGVRYGATSSERGGGYGRGRQRRRGGGVGGYGPPPPVGYGRFGASHHLARFGRAPDSAHDTDVSPPGP